ncbi:MAG: (Fe-S)-binding protein [Rhodospirillales bacterium]|nr:(Fe-S)-binding protein [Rhodospirillales bacterium]
MTKPSKLTAPNVALFITCLVDLYRPSVGFAAVKLLEDAGCTVSVPEAQTCCGQPAYNSGDRGDAIAIAKNVVRAFEGYDYVVAPSGSCAAMLREHYPLLLEDDPDRIGAARALAERTYELTAFLVDVLGVTTVDATFEGAITYHDGCSGLRELGIKNQPRQLLASVQGLALTEMATAENCCGFGGTFCVKYPEVSAEIARKKLDDVKDTGAVTLLAGDLGCLLSLAGKLSRDSAVDGAGPKIRHVAEVLAGTTDGPAIGEPADKG